MLLAATAGCSQRPDEAPKAAPAAPPPAPKVTVVKPQKQAVRRVVEQPGTVQAYEETQLFAKLPAFVRRLHADIGQKVEGPRYDSDGNETKPGTLLAELAVPELQEEAREKAALVRKAEAEVQQAVKALAAAGAGVNSFEALVAEAKAGLGRARALHARWESEAVRVAGLVKGGVIDAQTRDETENQFRSAQASRDEAAAHVASAQAAVAKAQADRDKAAADVDAAKARVDVARAAAAGVQALLSYTRIHAPFDGVVTRRRANTGDFLRPDGAKEGIFTVAKVDPVRVVFEVPEADAGLVKEGSAVTLAVQSLDGPPLEAKVTRTSWALQPGSRTLRAEVDVPNPDGRLRPGSYLQARVTAELPAALALPASAVMKFGDGLVCYRVVDGKAVRTPVQAVRSDGRFVQVARWQKPGTAEWVAFTGEEEVIAEAATVTDGQPVP
jgi:RND family efflux transporter MFP subunit